MIRRASEAILRVLRVPPRPHLPSGDPGTARVFRAGRHFWTLRLIGWSVRQAATLAGFLVLMAVLHVTPETIPVQARGRQRSLRIAAPLALVRALEGAAWALWLVQLPITFAVLRLDYELRWYIVTDRAARLREGILGLREMTFTLANVQDIRIRQGPLQRLLGLADVELRTAGGSEPSSGAESGHVTENLHLARFRGVDNAEEIRDLVSERMRRARGAGLGDPEDAAAGRSLGAPDLEEATRELLRESGRLRAWAARVEGET